MQTTCSFSSIVYSFLLYPDIPAFPLPLVRSSWEALSATLTLNTPSFLEFVVLAPSSALKTSIVLCFISLDLHHKSNPHTTKMSSDLPRTPSIIMDRHIRRGLDSMRRDAPGSSFARPPNGSPRSTMANTEEADPGEEQQKMTKTLDAVSVPTSVFSAADKELLKSGKYADAKVIANGKTYAVHKNVVCTRSRWFRKVLEGAFRVSAQL